jgi:DNA polymerase-3 subunit gamma/tau
MRGLSPASTLEEMGLVLQRMAVLQVVPSALDDPTRSGRDRCAWQAPCRPTRPSCCTACACIGSGRGELGLLAFKPGQPDGGICRPDDGVVLRLLAFKPATDRVSDLVLPAGQRLPVLDRPGPVGGAAVVAEAAAARPAQRALPAAQPSIEPVQVRLQADSVRDGVAAATAAQTLSPSAEGDFWHAHRAGADRQRSHCRHGA